MVFGIYKSPQVETTRDQRIYCEFLNGLLNVYSLNISEDQFHTQYQYLVSTIPANMGDLFEVYLDKHDAIKVIHHRFPINNRHAKMAYALTLCRGKSICETEADFFKACQNASSSNVLVSKFVGQYGIMQRKLRSGRNEITAIWINEEICKESLCSLMIQLQRAHIYGVRKTEYLLSL